MSFNKSIQAKKEFRQPYYDSRRFDHSCRHKGSCSYCSSNRQINNKKLLQKAHSLLQDYNSILTINDPLIDDFLDKS